MKKNKKSKTNKLLGETIFWLHTIILIIVVALGLFVAWYWVLIVVIGLRIQVQLLHGCILTTMEDKAEGHRKGTAYYYLAFKRFFGIRLTHREVVVVSISHDLIAVGVVLYATFHHVRLHL